MQGAHPRGAERRQYYPRGFSETELLFVYRSSVFASKMGQLAGNHFFYVARSP